MVVAFNEVGTIVTVIAGSSQGQSGYKDDVGANARFNWPFCMAMSGSGKIIIAENGSSTIWQLRTDGIVSTYFRDEIYRFTLGGIACKGDEFYLAEYNGYSLGYMANNTSYAFYDLSGDNDGLGNIAPTDILIAPNYDIYVVALRNNKIMKLSITNANCALVAGSADGDPTIAHSTTHLELHLMQREICSLLNLSVILSVWSLRTEWLLQLREAQPQATDMPME